MAFCIDCGSTNLDSARFCSACGKPIAATVASAATQPAAAGASSQPEYLKPRIQTGIPGFVKDALHPDEQVFAAFSASLWDHHRTGGQSFRHDKFLLTGQRIIYFHTGVVHKGMGEMPYRTITGVSYGKGLRHGKVTVEAANSGLTMDGIGNDDARFAERLIAGILAGQRYTAKK